MAARKAATEPGQSIIVCVTINPRFLAGPLWPRSGLSRVLAAFEPMGQVGGTGRRCGRSMRLNHESGPDPLRCVGER